MLIQGIDKSKACVLIAMDVLFNGNYEGKQWLEELFLEVYNTTGVPTQDLYLLEEAAPVIVCSGNYRVIHYQGDQYLQVINIDTKVRYRVPYYANILMFYIQDDTQNIGHGICTPAKNVPALASKIGLIAVVLQKQGLIVDRVRE